MKRAIQVLVSIAFAASLGAAQAQSEYPGKPVRIICDSAPGSATDVTARIVADGLSKAWGQQVVVLNHPGGGGSIAARVAASSPNDGYTIYMAAASTFTALAGAPGVADNLPLQLPRDFLPIGFVTQQPMVIAVSPALGVSTVPELIARAKAKPGEISYATTGRGRITHLTMELFQMRAGVKLQMIPYTGGPAQALGDLATGRVQIVLDSYSGLAGGLQAGAIKGLAVASLERLPGLNLPTVAETLPGFFAGGWNVMVAPIGTPPIHIRKVAFDLRRVLDEPQVKNKFAALGAYVKPMSAEDVVTFIGDQQKLWKPVAEAVAKDAISK
jgi:tripartite-type tricarboxylate transporter receptor subunit TctC